MTGFKFNHAPFDVPKVETKYRKIITQIPVPESIPMLEKMYQLESRSMHGQMPVIWDRAEDFQVYDAWGNVWIDFTSTIFVANAGHGNKRIRDELKKLLEKPLLHTYTYANKERIDYLEYLIANTPSQFEKAFLLSAGTEATETALKLMRLNGQKIGKRRGGIICFNGSFHGRTLGAQMMTGSEPAKEWIGYQDPNIHHLPFPYPWEKGVSDPKEFFHTTLNQLLEEKGLDSGKDLCGIMFETFQGWGAIFYPEGFVQEVVKYAHHRGILIAFDEMQAGFGRTGKLFGYMHYNVEPDLLCCGKGVVSGLPLALVLGSMEVMDLPGTGSMSSTSSANPVVCAAGKANLEVLLEDGLVENSAQLGKLFHDKLGDIKNRFSNHVNYVFGTGLLAAIHFNSPSGEALSELCSKICELALQRGLLMVHTGRETIKLAPPLSITREALLEGLEVLEVAIADCIEDSNY